MSLAEVGQAETPMPHFMQQVEAKENVHIVRMRGPIDMITIPGLDGIIRKAINHPGRLHKNILIDFTLVTRVDSATCAALVNALAMFKDKEHKLALVNISGELKNMLEISRLKKLFLIYESEEKAIEELDRPIN